MDEKISLANLKKGKKMSKERIQAQTIDTCIKCLELVKDIESFKSLDGLNFKAGFQLAIDTLKDTANKLDGVKDLPPIVSINKTDPTKFDISAGVVEFNDGELVNIQEQHGIGISEIECKCGAEGTEEICPYSQEIHETEDLCDCCDDCRHECAMDI